MCAESGSIRSGAGPKTIWPGAEPAVGPVPAPVTAPSASMQQLPQACHSIAADYALSYQFPQRIFHLRGQAPRPLHDIGHKRSAALLEVARHITRGRREAGYHGIDITVRAEEDWQTLAQD